MSLLCLIDRLAERSIVKLRHRLEEKETAMATLLKQMNAISSNLVDTGILPPIPGLFTSLSGLKSDLSSSPTKSSNTPNNEVSHSLRKLICDMESFKTYLIQVEDSRSKLAQLEAAQEATKRCLKVASITVCIDC